MFNNGKDIPVMKHNDEKMKVPTISHLLTSNYNDEEEKATGGRNGYGANLFDIFRTNFELKIATEDEGKSFKQTWTNNMEKATVSMVKDFHGTEFLLKLNSLPIYPNSR